MSTSDLLQDQLRRKLEQLVLRPEHIARVDARRMEHNMSNFTLDDVLTIEQDEDASPFEVASALQRAINGDMWSLQGSYGRSMMDAIACGHCLLGRHDCRDYYGTHIPSRDQVQSGTKGSYDYVVERMGKAWADRMKEV